MNLNFAPAEQILFDAIPLITPAAQVSVRLRGQTVWNRSVGWLDPPGNTLPVSDHSRFDLASVTKLFSSACFMRLVEQGMVTMDTPVSAILAEFNGLRPVQAYEDPLKPGSLVDVSNQTEEQVDAGSITFRQILCHNAGLPAWRPLYQQPDAQAARAMALHTFFSSQPLSRVMYSDIGLILLGMAIEKLCAEPLDQVIQKLVLHPLKLSETGYIPVGCRTSQDETVCAPTEFCYWRGRRITAEVHDENAWRLGGVSAHAGIFSTAKDIAAFGQAFLDVGSTFLQPETVIAMTSMQAEYGSLRRGLGFALWSPDPEASSNPFHPTTFGHTGFTGTCLWIDPHRELVVAFLTNEVYYGRANRGIAALRVNLHKALIQKVDDHIRKVHP